MPTVIECNRTMKTAIIIWLIAVTQSLLAISGIFGITNTTYERITFGLLELMTMVLVIANLAAINRFIAKKKHPIAYKLGRLCFYSLLFCFIGDIINRNFLQQFYQYDSLIKHSYLADSVVFFFPGYLILTAAVVYIAKLKGVSNRFLITTAILASITALYTYFDMHLANSSTLLTLITASYSVLVSILAVSAIWLLKAFRWRQASLKIWLVAFGLVLAMIADAIIGQFWIFGNQGQGYFPMVSHINWIIYVASQLLVQQLPLALLQNKHR